MHLCMPTFFKYSLIQACSTKGSLLLSSDFSIVSRNCVSLMPVLLAKTEAKRACGTSASSMPCVSRALAPVSSGPRFSPAFLFLLRYVGKQILLLLTYLAKTQFQALTFLTMSVHAWPVSSFLPDYLVHPPSPGRGFQLCFHANPSFTSAPFCPGLPKELYIANIQGITPFLSHPNKTTALHRDL